MKHNTNLDIKKKKHQAGKKKMLDIVCTIFFFTLMKPSPTKNVFNTTNLVEC